MSRNNSIYKNESEPFICGKCGTGVIPGGAGTHHRNHCPSCLWSMHVDLRTGDRSSVCRGMMEPIGIWVRGKNEWALIHRCVKCGTIRTNRIAADDSHDRLMALAVKPVMMFPFPYDVLINDGDEIGNRGGAI